MRTARICAMLLAAATTAACERQPTETAHTSAKQPLPVRANDVAGMLTKAGLPVMGVTPVSETTDPDHLLGQPGQYTSKALFSDGRHPKSGKSTIEVFASPANAMKRAEVVTSGAKNPAAITQYQAVSGKVYLRLDEALPAPEAAQYLKAFGGLAI